MRSALRRMGTVGIGLVMAATVAPQPAQADTAKVKVKDFLFKPRTITISKGDKVRWVNRGDEDHTTTSKTGLWDETLAPGESFPKKFKKPGTYKYVCTIHDDMKGKVIVVA